MEVKKSEYERALEKQKEVRRMELEARELKLKESNE